MSQELTTDVLSKALINLIPEVTKNYIVEKIGDGTEGNSIYIIDTRSDKVYEFKDIVPLMLHTYTDFSGVHRIVWTEPIEIRCKSNDDHPALMFPHICGITHIADIVTDIPGRIIQQNMGYLMIAPSDSTEVIRKLVCSNDEEETKFNELIDEYYMEMGIFCKDAAFGKMILDNMIAAEVIHNLTGQDEE